MLFLLSVAYAGPPLPQLGQGFGVGVSAWAATTTDVLSDPECAEGGNCVAHRAHSGTGGMLHLQVGPVVTGWLGAGADNVSVPQAAYEAAGITFDGGVSLNLRPKQDLGALVWLGGDYGASGDDAGEHARRWGVRAGGAVRTGRPDDGLGAWLGAELRVPGADLTATLGGGLELALAPVVPASVVGGFTVWSPPLSGRAGADMPRAFLCANASLGAENGFRAGLGAAF